MSHSPSPVPSGGDVILYQTEDGRTRLQVRLHDEAVWLSQAEMAEPFQRERSVITEHIRNIVEEGELVESAVCANHAQTTPDGKSGRGLPHSTTLCAVRSSPANASRLGLRWPSTALDGNQQYADNHFQKAIAGPTREATVSKMGIVRAAGRKEHATSPGNHPRFQFVPFWNILPSGELIEDSVISILETSRNEDGNK